MLVAVLGANSVPALGHAIGSTNAPQEKRYLFIVNTSKSMAPRLNGVLAGIQDLLLAGLSRELDEGDTIGIWTFNETLFTGQFPLQRWSAQDSRRIVSSALEFIRRQPFEKQARYDAVTPVLSQIVKQSQWLTVILVSDGRETSLGTPFDARIVEAFKPWIATQQKARLPVITVMRSAKGRITDFSVSTPPWPLALPPAPPNPKPVAKAAPAATAQPLIISGRKPETRVESAPLAAPEQAREANISTVPPPQTNLAPAPPTNAPAAAEMALLSALPPAMESAPATTAGKELPPDRTPIQTSKSQVVTSAPIPGRGSGTNLAGVSAQAGESTGVTSPAPPPPAPLEARHGSNTFLVVALAGTLVAALIVIVVLLFRPKTSSGGSFITRSLDRDDSE